VKWRIKVIDDCVYDWTKCTDDPLDSKVRDSIILYLNSIREEIFENNYDLYLAREVKNRSVLDIGICEHTLERMKLSSWKHNIIRNNAKYSLGVDIIRELVDELTEWGINAVYCDATSSRYLGKKFDIIHVGDVVEHVNSPVDLLNFCFRHLNINGKITLRTPNPFNYGYVSKNIKIGTDKSNLQHMSYICPIHAMEIVRRSEGSGILKKYLTMYPRGFTYKGIRGFIYRLLKFNIRAAFAEFFSKPESYSTIYVYEFGFQNNDL